LQVEVIMLSRTAAVSVVFLCACHAGREPYNSPNNSIENANSIGTTTLTSAEATDGWSRYERAVELSHQDRTDVALDTYREAESIFRKSNDRHGIGVAIYGEAHVLDEAGRCDEARAEYQRYASYIRFEDPNASALAIGYGHACQPIQDARDDSKSNGWGDYNRAIELMKDRRYDEAITAYRRAEALFMHDRAHHALAVYGRARALTAEGKCDEASRAYSDYAELVRSDSPHSADVALDVAKDCITK
jgi:tetratricopeptide (TPR) repeat protein